MELPADFLSLGRGSVITEQDRTDYLCFLFFIIRILII